MRGGALVLLILALHFLVLNFLFFIDCNDENKNNTRKKEKDTIIMNYKMRESSWLVTKHNNMK